MKKGKFLILVSLILVLAAASYGCSSRKTAVPTPKNQSLIIETPQLSSDKGALVVTLSYLSTNAPVQGQLFFLAKDINSTSSKDFRLPALDMTTAPKGSTADDGHLVMNMVAPGDYALVVFSPTGPELVQDAEGKPVVVKITANQVTDLGELKTTLDPAKLQP